MITDYPTPFATWSERKEETCTPPWPTAAVADGSWRYHPRRVSRFTVVAAALISAAVHASLFFGSLLITKKAAPGARVEEVPVVRLALPDLKELEEPEIAANDDTTPPVDLAVPVPMQADLPTLPQPSDFVQQLNFASLLEQPDLSMAKLSVIPEHFARASRIAESIGKIFNLEDLDRHPDPVLQPSPTYPFAHRREGTSATVIVEFIVDVQGKVLEPVVTDSSHSGFNEAALTGVSRWKFRPGMKSGRKVNVRMRVPIVFKLADVVID